MLVAITASDDKTTSKLDARFGRAKFIILYNSEDNSFTIHDNALNLNAPQGAGIQTAQNVVELGAHAVITGNMGPKAFRVLEAGSVRVFTSNIQSVENAYQEYLKNNLQELTNPNVKPHWN